MNFDYERKKDEILKALRSSCPNILFDATTACSIEDADETLRKSTDYDGVVIYLIGSTCIAPLLIMERCEKPVILVDEPYCGTGTFALAYGWAKSAGLPILGVASSDLKYTADRINLLSVISRLRRSKIILITPREEEKHLIDERTRLLYASGKYGGSGKTYEITEQIDRLKKLFGVEVIRLSYNDIKRYFKAASEEEAKRIADELISKALRIVEPSYEEIVKSARLYLGLRKMIDDYKADAITIDCYRRFHELPAYPCIAFSQLNNEGLTAVCEADLSSTIAQLLIRYLTEELTGQPRPGFVNDPVADFSKNLIIYCHCTAPTMVYGPGGRSSPYVIRSHAESGGGAAIQSLMPLDEPITALQIHFMRDPPLMVIHQSKAICHIDSEEGCRTKLAAKADVEKIFSNWNRLGGWILPAHWHRVVVYGSWREELKALAVLLRLEVFEEDVE